jgi:HAD superfamily hydrolase (TIGR01509 family)
MNQIKAVIFDFDGVIVDTEKISLDVAKRLMKRKFNIDLTTAEIKGKYGRLDKDWYNSLLKKHSIDVSVDDLLMEHNQQYDGAIDNLHDTLPGVQAMLEKAEKQNWRKAICTGSYSYQVSLLLKNFQLQDKFDIIVGSEHTLNHKPHKEPYLFTAKKLNIKPENILVLEDSEAGVTSAKAAGMYVIGVMIGNHNTQDLSDADKIIQTLKEII